MNSRIVAAGLGLVAGASCSARAPLAAPPLPSTDGDRNEPSRVVVPASGLPVTSAAPIASALPATSASSVSSATPGPCPDGDDDLPVDLGDWIVRARGLRTLDAWGEHLVAIRTGSSMPTLSCNREAPSLLSARHSRIVLREGAAPNDVLEFVLGYCSGAPDAIEEHKLLVYAPSPRKGLCIVARQEAELDHSDGCSGTTSSFIDAVSTGHKTLRIDERRQLGGRCKGNTGDNVVTTRLLELGEHGFREVLEVVTRMSTPRRFALQGALSFTGPAPRTPQLTITGSACGDDDISTDPNTGWFTCGMKPVRHVRTFRWAGDHYEERK